MLAQVSRTLVCALHRLCELTLLVELAMAVHVHVLARRWLLLAFAAGCRAASRGIGGARACKQVRLLVVGCWLFVLARIAVLCSLPLLNHHHPCVHHYHYHYHH